MNRNLISARTNQLAPPRRQVMLVPRRSLISPRTNQLYRGMGCVGCQYSALGALGVELSDQQKAQLISAASTFLQNMFSGHPQDGRRYQANYDAYGAALNGNCEAVKYLRQRTGSYGIEQVNYAPPGESPQAFGGWATKGPRDDAAKKYASAAPYCGMAVQPPINPTQPPAINDMPTPAEIQTAVSRMMQNLPVGRDALRWVTLGFISPAQVAAAQAIWGQRLYQPGGALDPAQGSVLSVPPLNLSGTQIAMIAGGIGLGVLLLASSSGRRSR